MAPIDAKRGDRLLASRPEQPFDEDFDFGRPNVWMAPRIDRDDDNVRVARELRLRHGDAPSLVDTHVLDEQRWPLGPLPFVLPGGCSLLVDPAVGLGAVTDAAGFATVSLSVPNDSRLIGFGAYSQWIVGAALASSEAAAIRIGL